MVLIFAVAYVLVRWINAGDNRQLLIVGITWASLTVLFEFGLGLLVLGYPWDRILEDYDLTRGGFMGIGIVFMFFAPFLTVRLQRSR
jgi:hypothetical protein